MLTYLSVHNLAIVQQLELHFFNGMHVITGETGAGKSILMQALNLILGERAPSRFIGTLSSKAEITACFDISQLNTIQHFLDSKELLDGSDCIIRRTLNKDGRSRAYINGHIAPMSQLKTLGAYLMQVHSQHQHHALLDSDYQRKLLDNFAKHPNLLQAVAGAYKKWHDTQKAIQTLTQQMQHTDKLSLLNYQIQEIESLELLDNELEQLDQEHRRLSHAHDILQAGQAIVTQLSDSEPHDVLSQCHQVQQQLQNLKKITPDFSSIEDLVAQATVLIQEAAHDLSTTLDNLDQDPEKLIAVEKRLSMIHQLARKLKVAPEFLSEHYNILCNERDQLTDLEVQLETLTQAAISYQQDYQKVAKKLSESRKAVATKLAKQVCKKLSELELAQAQFAIELQPIAQQTPTAYGQETVQFKISTNPGQPLCLLKQVASGGEMSRISLAIQVITAEQQTLPTLIFDEADVGISGKTAAIVGNLMKQLSQNTQIVCVTHLPQVAAKADHHYKVAKQHSNVTTYTTINHLSTEHQVEEVARLMGDETVTLEAKAQAKILMKQPS